jgi:beta-phosphoglucomutase-like phosphatase (HAD superfamily)
METGTERRFDAVIFDLDGTLVDTEPLHERSWTLALAELGLTMPEGEYSLYFAGRPGIQSCLERFGMSLEEAIATSDLVTLRYWELAAGNVAPLPGLVAFLDRLDDITHGKPHPEIFLTAAAKLVVAPERCLAFEDSAPGLAAARAAGMTCVGITTTRRILDDAHHVIDSYEDELLRRLL